MEPVAVIGIGCRFPFAPSPDRYWQLLREGREAIRDMPEDRRELWTALGQPEGAAPRGGYLDVIDAFEPEYFGISPREAASMDPQQRLLLELTVEALEDAGHPPRTLAEAPVGVFIGAMNADHALLHGHGLELMDGHLGIGSSLGIAANRISYTFDFRGPSLLIDTLCSSSLVATHQACRALLDDESMPLALAGGINLMIFPGMHLFYERAGLLSPDARCRPFDAGANGMVRGEGGGILVLKRLSRALSDGDSIYCVIRGSAVNHDGKSNGLTAPSRFAQERVLRGAYEDAGISPNRVDYIEAHGTGTLVGDPIELKALAAVLAEREGPPCAIGSVKGNFGHLESAAGVAGLIKAALCLHHRQLCPSLHFETPNPLARFDRLPLCVSTRTQPFEAAFGPRTAGVSSFGLGGTNAHVVLQEAPEPAALLGRGASRRYLLPLSARSEPALRALGASMADALDRNDSPLADVLFTLGARRTHHERRVAVTGANAAELSRELRAFVEREVGTGAEPAAEADATVALDPVEQAARDYLAGGPLDPSLIPEGRVARLASYPFQRRRLRTPIASLLRTRRTHPVGIEAFTYRQEFRAVRSIDVRDESGPVLLLGAEPELERQLCLRLDAAGIEYLCLGQAACDARVSHPGTGIAALFADVVERLGRLPKRVIVCSSPDLDVEGDEPEAAYQRLRAAYALTLGALQWVLAMRSQQPDRRVRVWVITSGGLAVTSAEAMDCRSAALVGLCRSVCLEQPEAFGGLVDLDLGFTPVEQAEAILDGTLCDPLEPIVCVRRDGRWAPRLVRGIAGPVGSEPFDTSGTVLVTGGLGALGRQVVRALVQRGARHVVLVGRNGPSEQARADLDEFESTGAVVRTVAVDVADASGLEACVKDLEKRLPPICGVVHCAGVLEDALLGDQTLDGFDRVARGKALGGLNLTRLFRSRPLSFFVLFSSAAAVVGSPGQANYAAANAALYALAHERRRQGQTATVLQYGPWTDGMARNLVRTDGVTALRSSEGIAAFLAVVTSGALEATVLNVDLARLSRSSARARRLPMLEELLPESAESARDDAQPANLEAWLDRQLAATLGLTGTSIARDRPLVELGLDSMLGLELKERLERTLSGPLPIETLMDASVEQILSACGPLYAVGTVPSGGVGHEPRLPVSGAPGPLPASSGEGRVGSWLVPIHRPVGAAVRLFCFAYAGGAARVFQHWGAALGDAIELWAIELPGRGARRTEPLLTSVDAIVDQLMGDLLPELDRPFAFFGHCLGAILMFETARRAVRQGCRPLELFVSGAPAPQLYLIPSVYVRSDERFREVLELINFKSSEPLLKDDALLRRALPSVRADFEAAATYEFHPGEDGVLPIAITAFGAHDDLFAPQSALEPWRERTASEFRLYMRPGGHYFLETEREFLHQTLRVRLGSQPPLSRPLSEPTRRAASVPGAHPRQPGASRRLVCFPFAGSNSHSFEHFIRSADPATEVLAMALPSDGRATTLRALAARLVPRLLSELDRPCAWFGHDLGALLMHEVMLLLHDDGQRLPEHAFVSRSIAPQLNFFPPVHVFADDKFRELVRFFGLPTDDELSLRRDFELIAGYRAARARALPVPITAFAGRNDTLVPSAGVSGWRDCTTSTFTLHLDDGAHHVLQPDGPDALTCERLLELWHPRDGS